MRFLEAMADEQKALAEMLKILLVKLRKTAALLDSVRNDIPLREKIGVIKSIERAIAVEIKAISEKEATVDELLKTLLACSKCTKCQK